MWHFPWNWHRIWRCSVFWFPLTVRRKSAPCSWSCRKTGAACAGHPPGSAPPPGQARPAAVSAPPARGSHRWSSRPARSAHPKAAEYSVTWAMNAEPPPGVCSIEPRKVLPSHTSWSRSAEPPGIWAIVQSRIAAQRATTSTCKKK